MKDNRVPDRVCKIGGREFLLYLEYDDICERDIIIYPDFDEEPEYSIDGRPFTMSTRERCENFVGRFAEDEQYRECGVCKWFDSSETQQNVIGICTCEAYMQYHFEKENEKK